MDLKLDEIKEILEQPDFNVEQALYEHQQKLLEKRNEIDRLLASVQQTLHHYKGEINMSDQQNSKHSNNKSSRKRRKIW